MTYTQSTMPFLPAAEYVLTYLSGREMNLEHYNVNAKTLYFPKQLSSIGLIQPRTFVLYREFGRTFYFRTTFKTNIFFALLN
jgi:hypothetical protein